MRGVLAALRDVRCPFHIITRSPLIVRDLDLLVACARRADVAVTVSIATLDAALAKHIEPTVAPPAQRLRAVAALAEAGIRVSVGVAPVLPDLTDTVDSLRAVVQAAAAAGAHQAWHNALNLGEVTRDAYFAFLEDQRPDLVERYRRIYRHGRYAESAYARQVAERMRVARAGVHFRAPRRLAPDPSGEQLALMEAL
jgi:DNA repair photolyase